MRKMILTLAMIGSVAAVVAQSPPPGASRRGAMLMRADANGDGVLTRAEAIAEAAARFDQLDADRDGRLTRNEMLAAFQARRLGGRGDVPPPPPGQ